MNFSVGFSALKVTPRLIYGVVASVVFVLSACESGSGSSSGGTTTEKPRDTAKESFSLGGKVSGLKGSLILANGSDLVNVSANGVFTFSQKLEEGIYHQVSVKTMPEHQQCSVKNGTGYIYRNKTNLIVDCADMVRVKPTVSLPKNYALSDLKVLSNYSELGGDEGIDIDDTSKILTFRDTIVSLLNSDDEVLYLAYTLNADSTGLVIDSKSTAMALVLLEPAIANSLQDRGLTVSDIYSDLMAAIDEDGALSSLAADIEIYVGDLGKSLSAAPSLSFAQSLPKALNLAADYIVALPLPERTPDEDFEATSYKTKPIKMTLNTGVEYSFRKGLGLNKELLVDVSNTTQRFVNVGGATAAPTLIAPHSIGSLTFKDGIASQQTMDLIVNGPGAIGEFDDASLTRVKQATIATGALQYALSGLKPLMGLYSESRNLNSCFSATYVDKLLTEVSSAVGTSIDTDLRSDNYYRVLTSIASKTRTILLNRADTSAISVVDDLLNCDIFSSGVLLDANRPYISKNMNGILGVVNANLNSAELGDTFDLFKNEAITYLSQDLMNLRAQGVTSISNELNLSVEADRIELVAGDVVKFSSECYIPVVETEIIGAAKAIPSDDSEASKDADVEETVELEVQIVPCNVSWDFGDTSSAVGGTAQHLYDTEGSYTVTVKAIDEYLAESTQQIIIDVVPEMPRIALENEIGGNVELDELAYNFDQIIIGEASSITMTLKNTGFSPLNISTILSSNPAFSISASSLVIAQSKSVPVKVTFKPTSSGDQSSTFTIESDDPNLPSFTFVMKGKGVSVVKIGEWKVEAGSDNATYSGVRIKTLYNAGDLEDADDDLLQIRLFGSAVSDYPQIAITLNSYGLNKDNASRGVGEYTLNDSESGFCFGLFSRKNETTQTFCTRTTGPFKGAPAAGAVVVEAIDGSDTLQATFSFLAYPQTCVSQSACDSISVSGSFEFNNY